jgi:hypothetical protein
MFLAITCFAAIFAVLGAIGLAASFGLLLVLTLVGLHVVGNALGTRLRDEISPAGDQEADAISRLAAQSPLRFERSHSVSGLYKRARLGWLVHVATVIGALTGGSLGVSFLVNFENTSTRGLIVGAASSGVLGAFFGFLYGSFLKTWLSAWWQASSESERLDGPTATKATALRSDVLAPVVADFDARLTIAVD